MMLVDDDEELCQILRGRFTGEGFKLSAVHSINAANRRFTRLKPALVMLDITLPDGSGLNYCSRLRASGYNGVIIMLTARGATEDRIDGLERGADDYLAKPFEFRELLARTRNWLRISGFGTTTRSRRPRYARFGPWLLDLLRPCIFAPDRSVIMLSTAEHDILKRLCETPHAEVNREELIPERRQTVHLDRSLDNRICRLRTKLSRYDGGDKLIVTVRNRGFMLGADVDYETAQ